MNSLLEVKNLRTHFSVEDGEFRAVDGVGFTLEAGRTLGIVGESGCGKSVTALSIMGLVPRPPGRIAGGEILFEGGDLLKLDAAGMRALRGDRISMIFQEPMSSLNPAFTIGDQIAEVLLQHRKISRKCQHSNECHPEQSFLARSAKKKLSRGLGSCRPRRRPERRRRARDDMRLFGFDEG